MKIPQAKKSSPFSAHFFATSITIRTSKSVYIARHANKEIAKHIENTNFDGGTESAKANPPTHWPTQMPESIKQSCPWEPPAPPPKGSEAISNSAW
jgi:hypothetical protein